MATALAGLLIAYVIVPAINSDHSFGVPTFMNQIADESVESPMESSMLSEGPLEIESKIASSISKEEEEDIRASSD